VSLVDKHWDDYFVYCCFRKRGLEHSVEVFFFSSLVVKIVFCVHSRLSVLAQRSQKNK
jgi:hypothetical protein